MERVTGIGGFFFRASDPLALAQWYADHLGVDLVPPTYEERVWWQETGPTVFAPFPADTEFFGRDEQSWMINFRVRDRDALVKQLRDAGVDVDVDPEVYPNGRFARLVDPEGNPIQLWEPTADELARSTTSATHD
jgi:glyoxylase I family protein